VGSISGVLTPGWLQWAKVTHVLGALRRFDEHGEELPEYTAVLDASLAKVRYYNFPIRQRSQQARYPAIFQAMQDVLECHNHSLFVFSKNGLGRSSFLIYSFLRVWHRLTHEHALLTLRGCRRDCDPLFCYEDEDHQCVEWLESVLANPTFHSEEVFEWQFGQK